MPLFVTPLADRKGDTARPTYDVFATELPTAVLLSHKPFAINTVYRQKRVIFIIGIECMQWLLRKLLNMFVKKERGSDSCMTI